MVNPEIAVRMAGWQDIAYLVEIEKRVWEKLRTQVFTAEHFKAWLETNQNGFLVAESGQDIVGFTYTQIINFSFQDAANYRSFNDVTDSGYSKNTHCPDGNSLFGVTIVSIKHGAGQALHAANLGMTRTLKKQYFVTTSRLSGFEAYYKNIEESSLFKTISAELETAMALWYAIECTQRIGGKIWGTCPPQPTLPLSPPEKLDPVLSAHLRGDKDFGLAGVIPSFMHDPQSRDYATLNVYQAPPFA